MENPTDIDTAPRTQPPNTSALRSPLCLASMVRVEFGALTHVGRVRRDNEDHYLVARLGRSLEALMTNLSADVLPDRLAEFGYGMVVADGMGGASGGEIASGMAVTLLANLVAETAKWGRRIDKEEAEALMERAVKYYSQIHSALIHQAEAEPALSGMGTTLTLAYSFCSDLFVAHVGDSRAYLFRGGGLHRLTHDQTVAQEMVDRGLLPPEALATHRYRHVLTSVLGGRAESVDTPIQHYRLADRDRLLLCSDGLTDMVDDKSITEVLRQRDAPADACQELVDRALAAGGRDNITVVLAQYSFASTTAGNTASPPSPGG